MKNKELLLYFLETDYAEFVMASGRYASLSLRQEHVEIMIESIIQRDGLTTRHFIYSFPGLSNYFPEYRDWFLFDDFRKP